MATKIQSQTSKEYLEQFVYPKNGEHIQLYFIPTFLPFPTTNACHYTWMHVGF